MKTSRIIASAVLLLALSLLLSQSAGVGAQSAARPNAAQLATTDQPASGFSAKLTRPNDQAPYLVTFQGRLTDHNGNPITTVTNLTFKLYTVPSGGSAIFSEGPVSVTPNAQGLLTYQVGSTVTINAALIAQFASSLYLGVSVASDAEMTPRLALTAAPYAMSLAPGAVISGPISGGTGPQGVVNAINNNRSSALNAGLFASGATAVFAQASSTGSSNGAAGEFDNSGGGSGTQSGVYATNSSSGGYAGFGGDFINNGGGSGSQYGISASTVSSGGTTGYGAYLYNAGGGSGGQYGINASTSSTGGTFGYGGQFTNNGGGSGSQVGIFANTSSAGGTDGYGGQFYNYGGGNGRQYGVYTTSPGYGLYAHAGASTDQQQSAGVVGQSSDANGAGGVFTGTSGVVGYSSSSGYNDGTGGDFINAGGGSGTQYGIKAITSSTGGYDSIGGNFTNNGGGFGDQYGINAITSSTGGHAGYGGYFFNNGGGSREQYGIIANTYSTGGTSGYGGRFINNGGGSGPQYGIESFAPTSGGAGGYSGYFGSNSSTAVAVFVNGKVQATGGCCASAFYDIQVKYHGSGSLHPGDVVAADGNNETVDGTPTLGVIKANAQNADLALGVVQYRMKKIGTEKDGRGDWQVDEKAISFASGDLLSAVVLGQVRMKVSGAGLGSHLALTADGSINVAVKGADNLIGKVVSQPDKDGYVTVFINLK